METSAPGLNFRRNILKQMAEAKRRGVMLLNDDGGPMGGNNTAEAYERRMAALSESGKLDDHMNRMLLLQGQGKLGAYLALSNIIFRVQAPTNLLPPSADEC